MLKIPLLLIKYLFICLCLLFVCTSFAQTLGKNAVQKQWKKMIHYQQLDGKISEIDFNSLVDAKILMDDISKPVADRENAGKQIAAIILEAFGSDTAGIGASINDIVKTPVKDNEPVIIQMEYPSTPMGHLAEVIEMGKGPIPLILISEYRKNWGIYKEFMEANSDKFKMYAITLPGYNNSNAYPMPEFVDYSKRVWLNSVADGIVSLIRKKKIDRPVIVGSLNAGTYISARIALNNPELIRGIVVLNGDLYDASVKSKTAPEQKPGLAERTSLVNADYTNILWPIFQRKVLGRDSIVARLNRRLSPRHIINIYTRDSVRVKRIYEMHLSFRPFLERYDAEWQTADLTDDFKKMTVPILAGVSVADEAYPFNSNTRFSVNWESFKLDNPSLSITVLPFADCRQLIAMDAPEELGNAIDAFVRSKPLTGTVKKIYANRASPSALVEQVLGAGKISIQYGRPQVKGREIWGKLVPYDKVWRAGANEATQITFTKSIKIEGNELAAGTYTFFALPTAGSWTIIFNKIKNQWGAFRYNKDYDALRIAVSPRQTEQQEWLEYSFENIKDNTGEIWLRWEKILIPLRVEMSK
jgi:pimeloyl-ACP methyl ester carboxylesterase